ncbi:MAG: NUDIX domain-containing protein [bacterium]
MRAPFQVMVLPYKRQPGGQPEYCILKRRDAGYWEFMTGGGEDRETPLEAARREAHEEAGLSIDLGYRRLDSTSTVPADAFGDFIWGREVLVIPQYCFAVDAAGRQIVISSEHTEHRWCTYDDARLFLRWDSHRNALWELDYRLSHDL